jgi:hypothetical protein
VAAWHEAAARGWLGEGGRAQALGFYSPEVASSMEGEDPSSDRTRPRKESVGFQIWKALEVEDGGGVCG